MKSGLDHGLQLAPIKIDQDYIFGGFGSLGGDILKPDGQWSLYLPQDEVQNLNGIEPYACVSFGTLNVIETLIKEQYGEERNFSDRFLAKATGTDKRLGNDPQTVAEFLRTKGVVAQTDWGFDSWIDTFEKFYLPFADVLYTIALRFTAEFVLKHEYVPTDKESLKNALKYSPLAVGVYAWQQNAADLYVSPPGATPNHCTVLCGYEEGQYWLVFDSYDSTHKKLEWDFPFAIAKRFKLTRQTDVESKGWFDFISTLFAWWPFGPQPVDASVTPQTPITAELPASPTVPTVPSTVPPAPTVKLEDLCMAIRTHEGWFPGSRSFKNNNPGNCRYSTVGYDASYLPVLKDAQGFAVFKDYATGWRYLLNLVKLRIKIHPEWTLVDFFKIYAPSTDGNDPIQYAAVVAKQLGVDSTFKIKNISA